jgi:hypothetical protein
VAGESADCKSRQEFETVMPRPPHVKPPAYLSKSPPVPDPRPARPEDKREGEDPTRYGDWTKKGIAVDF